MKTSQIRSWRALASLATLAAVLTATPLVMAQPADPADAEEAKPDDEDSAATPTPEPPAEAEKEATTGEVEAEASATLDAALGKETELDTSAEAAPASEASPADATAHAVRVVGLSESAYPEPQTRGLRGGSLWFTMHGLQWPYLPMSATPGISLGVSGYLWVDPSYAMQSSEEEGFVDETRYRTQGRVAARLTPTYSMPDDWFVQGQVELVANSDQTSQRFERPDTDDLWVRAGQWNKWDVQLGRFEGWEVYHYGMGLDQHTFERVGTTLGSVGVAPPVYGATFGYYRDSVGNIAAHAYPLDILRFEVLGKFGSERDEFLFEHNALGVRPAAVLDMGMIKAKLGGEYIRRGHAREDIQWEQEQRGGAAAVQFILEPYIEAGLNAGFGLVDTYDTAGVLDPVNTYTTYSYGGFANGRVMERLLVGAGAHYSWKDDVMEDSTGRVGEFDHLQVFGAVQYAVFDQLYLKLVGAYSRGRFAPTAIPSPPYDSTMLSGRLRASLFF